MRVRSLLTRASAVISAGVLAFTLTANAANAGVRAETTAKAASISTVPRTQRNGLCTGTWSNVVANVTFQRSKNGALTWGFKLTRVAIGKLGPVVEVTMPTATVNGHAINPPYSPHTEPSTYNFHSSFYKYHRVGDGDHTLATGNKILLYWVIFGSTGTNAYRYVRCTVPKPGSA